MSIVPEARDHRQHERARHEHRVEKVLAHRQAQQRHDEAIAHAQHGADDEEDRDRDERVREEHVVDVAALRVVRRGEVRIREIEKEGVLPVVRLLAREHQHRERVEREPGAVHRRMTALKGAQHVHDRADEEEHRGEVLDDAALPHHVLPVAAEERLRPVDEDDVDDAEDDRQDERGPAPGRHARSTARQGEPSPPAIRSGRQ